MQLSIVKNYSEVQSEIAPMEAIEALWNLVYCRASAPQVRVLDENRNTVIEYNHGTLSHVDEGLADWIYENIHSHSVIRVTLNIAPYRS